MDFPSTLMTFRAFTQKHPNSRGKLIEDKANGPAVIATLRREISGIIPVNPQGGKEARAAAVSPYAEAGNIYLPDPKVNPWVWDFIEELAGFPAGANDDMVDCTSQAIHYLADYQTELLLARG